jgi:hypothetical protein
VVGNKGIIEAIRLLVAGAITALSSVDSHNPYVLGAVTAASVLATHVVPSITQKGITMTTPVTPETPSPGAVLMGIARPVETAVAPAVPAVETAAEAVETAVKTPDTENVETAVADAVPAVEAVVKVAPDAATALRDAADSLRKIADSLV